MHFSFNFGFLPILMFMGVFAVIISIIVKNISEEVKNSKAPVQTVTARIVSKRTAVSSTSGSMDANGMMTGGSSSTAYYVTFEAPDGSRLELKVRGSEYGMLAEGDYGELTYQRKRYLGFNRQAAPEQLMYAQQMQNQQQFSQAMQDQQMLEQSMQAQRIFSQTLPQQTQNFIQTDTDRDQRAQF